MSQNHEAVDKVRQHYDHQTLALHSQTREEREKGAAGPLKQFHNTIKRQLLHRFAKAAPKLLDLACGRGGDIHKWVGAQIGFVKGIDLSENEIWEARRRFQDLLIDRAGVRLKATFAVSASLGTADLVDRDGPFDIVTCMFAIHYFFASEKTAQQFLRNVSQNLLPGGHFIGTVLSGRRVMNTIKEGKAWPIFQAPMLSIKAQWQHDPKPFGCGYSCAIGDTVTAGSDSSEGSYEYLVFFSTLVALAKQCDLHPVVDYGTSELHCMFDEADRDAPIKHFRPRFPEHSDPSLAQASALNAAFVFRKGSAAAPQAGTKRQRTPEQAQQPPAKLARTSPGPHDSPLVYSHPASREASPNVTRVAGSAAELRSTRAHMARSPLHEVAPAAHEPEQDRQSPTSRASSLANGTGVHVLDSTLAEDGSGKGEDVQSAEPGEDHSTALPASLTAAAENALTPPRETGSGHALQDTDFQSG